MSINSLKVPLSLLLGFKLSLGNLEEETLLLTSFNVKQTLLCIMHLFHSIYKSFCCHSFSISTDANQSHVACPRELGHLRSAPSVSTWKEVDIGAPSRPFALRRSSQLARNIKGTHLRIRTPWMDALKVVK